MNLPHSENLPIANLASCFNDTSATYKFYWLLAIIQSAEQGNEVILKRELFSRMVANAWFTVNFFKVTFGKSDVLQRVILDISHQENIPIHENQEAVFNFLNTSESRVIERQLAHFNKNVPHWFLSPWYPKIDKESDTLRKNRIYSASQQFDNLPLYALYPEKIIIRPQWFSYLIRNSKLLKDFCYWNLALFIQSRNPNVPDIPNKLIKSAQRSPLNKQRKKFWDVVFDELGTITCIYTGKTLIKSSYAVEHFIPYSFVSHDLIWNLIPADPAFNSAKSNRLPLFDLHFPAFFELQQQAFSIIKERAPRSTLLEEYLTIFPDLDQQLEKTKFEEAIKPLLTIANNNGFQYLQNRDNL